MLNVLKYYYFLIYTLVFKLFSCSSLTLKRGCSVLLMGPNGSGKVTVVIAASRRLHLHLIKVIYDFYTLFFLSFVFFHTYEHQNLQKLCLS